ncbi:MAG TPA: hypothetical protein VFI19_01185 [Nocardioides sp.]|nr:hypothetical protein [Nocardioides sp.]
MTFKERGRPRTSQRPQWDRGGGQLAENPHLKWADSRRGYVVLDLSANALRAHFRTLPFVSRPGARVSTAATFALEDGVRGLVRRR